MASFAEFYKIIEHLFRFLPLPAGMNGLVSYKRQVLPRNDYDSLKETLPNMLRI
ncbi:TPA: hypothetical protein L9V39_003804 [Klebsiella pneumoniae]|nr:hypothetical protein [Klebsiella pneumoniae]